MDKITILQYCKLDANERLKYDSVLQHLKPSNKFAGKEIDIIELTYIEVRKMMHLVNQKELPIESIYDVFKLSFKVCQDEFNNASIDEYYSAKNHIGKMLIDMQKKETQLLKSVGIDEGKWEQAGGSRLNAFSNILPLVQLGEIYGIYPYDMQYKPYQEIITLLVCHKTKNEVNSKYQELKTPTPKSK